ncbi:4'-phosphopantetheinyl transferase family protein [Chitiniphilus shinanonensis]|uniref:4'-phosphopantetheinyl transferase family protein n=1 Tax=Chitiniphilus shinanonensis TaxID=553088 RepID=UPI0030628E5E
MPPALPSLPHLPTGLHFAHRAFTLDDAQLDTLLHSGLTLPESLAGAVLKRKVEFLAGRDCARSALALAGYPGPFALPIGEHRAPVWPEGWTGSISHSKGHAIAVAGRATIYRGIGLDLEHRVPAERAAPLREQIGQPAEWLLGDTLGLPPELWFTLVFSLKEALFKALYPQVGRYFGFEDAEVVAFDDGLAQLRLCATLAPTLPAGLALTARSGWDDAQVLSLCLG